VGSVGWSTSDVTESNDIERMKRNFFKQHYCAESKLCDDTKAIGISRTVVFLPSQ
jgi:hypothetical protein